jgi:oxepin-CoA hydrolase/3-oxo-5,6-dehydrosuberyl-CoA semialdehyde dehydrogenase
MTPAFLELDITLLINKLDELTPNTQPKWGGMSAQQMVEHLSDSIKISSGKLNVGLEIPEDKIAKMQEILASDKEMPKNFVVPFAKKDTPLRHEELALAIDEFLLEWIDFEEYFNEKPHATAIHPYYGPLKYDQWLRLHSKHFTHHFQQFGLI